MVKGGCFIDTPAQAERLAAAMAKEGFDQDPPEPGQFVELQKCIPDHEDCPRVELDVVNVSAAALCMVTISAGEMADRTAPMIWNAHAGHLPPAEKQRLTGKIMRACNSQHVLDYFRRREANRRDNSG